VVVVVVGALVAKLTWRPRGQEAHSVSDYQAALDTIQQLTNRNAGASVRVIDGAGARDGSTSRGLPLPVLPDASPTLTGGQENQVPLVFDDARPKDKEDKEHYGREAVEQLAPEFRSDRARRQAIHSMEHRPRRWAATALTVVAVLGFAALAYAGSRHPSHGHSSTSTTLSSATTRTTRTTETTKRHHSGKSTTTPAVIVATSSSPSGQSAVYPVSSGPYQVTVDTTAPCWVNATSASGSTLWTGTVQAGASQIIKATGPMTLELGAPGATLKLGDLPVDYPTPFHTPFTAMFEPTSSSGSSATTVPPTTSTTTSAAP
jgi:hypothetical protein